MMRRRHVLHLVVLIALAVVVPASADPLQRVPADKVCMMNNTVFPTPQIAVPVDGKTYFGCCEMCKGRLAVDPTVREAVDPVSGKTVDKATAVIGALPDGKVLYFESEKTFAAYLKRKPS